MKLKTHLLVILMVAVVSCSLFKKTEPEQGVATQEPCLNPHEALYVWTPRGYCNITNPSVAQLDSLSEVNNGYGWGKPDTSSITRGECLSFIKNLWPEWKKQGKDYNVVNYNRVIYCIICGENFYAPLEYLER